MSLLVDKNSDFNTWYSRLRLRLKAKGLWDDFCEKPEVVPDQDTDSDAFTIHIQRRQTARWKIAKTLSDQFVKEVSREDTPYGMLCRLRRIFEGNKLSAVYQLRAVVQMKYTKGSNVCAFIAQLKQGFIRLDNMGFPLPATLKPYILVMALDGAFETILGAYFAFSFAKDEDIEFDKVVQLVESAYLETKEREKLERQDGDLKSAEPVKYGYGWKQENNGKCHHCHLSGHYVRECRFYRKKRARGWKHPLPCRSRKDFDDDDRDPTRMHRATQKHEEVNENSRVVKKRKVTECGDDT